MRRDLGKSVLRENRDLVGLNEEGVGWVKGEMLVVGDIG